MSLLIKQRFIHEAELNCLKVATQALEEYLRNYCKTCRGAKELIVGDRRITCDVCLGYGIRRWTDFERARAMQVSLNRAKTLQRHIGWAVGLMLTMDRKVNDQMNDKLGRWE